MTINPWTEISSTKRVLDRDLPTISRYNSKKSKNSINCGDFPEPFLGNVESEIYLLVGNPGFDPTADVYNYSADQEQSVLRNLNHTNNKEKYPFYLLDPLFEGHGGFKWWNDTFSNLIKELKVDKSVIAQRFFCLELYGYHSETGDSEIFNRLPSSLYTKHLVEKAVKQKKLILICRGITKWLQFVPALEAYDNCLFVASNRGIQLSKSTIPPIGYRQVRQILTK